jgi:uncharacterized DUF497 family protein
VKVAWDAAKNLANQRKHGLSFEEAQELFLSGRDYLEIFDDAHSDTEDRFIAIRTDRPRSCPRRVDRARRGHGAHHQQRSLGNQA